jgi:hypothetical protein
LPIDDVDTTGEDTQNTIMNQKDNFSFFALSYKKDTI